MTFRDSLTDMGNRGLSFSQSPKFRQTWVAQLAAPGMFDLPGFKPSGIASWYGGTN